jgi:hypothetical protein
MEATCVNNILIMEFRNSKKCILLDPFRYSEGQVLLGEAKEMSGEVLENEHGLLRDGVFDQTDMVGATA